MTDWKPAMRVPDPAVRVLDERFRPYVLPLDVGEVAPEVIRHRLVLTYQGIAAGVTPETIVWRLLQRFPPPRLDLGDRVAS